MPRHDLMEIIRTLNGGRVLPVAEDERTHKAIPNEDDIVLFVEPAAPGRYFFFSPYEHSDDLAYLNKIENVVCDGERYKEIQIEPPVPHSAYLVLFYKLPDDYDIQAASRQIIQVEENIYLFKKSVFYYSEKELESFTTWCSEQEETTFESLLRLESVQKSLRTPIREQNAEEHSAINFLLRLAIKLPYFTFQVRPSDIGDFDGRVVEMLNSTRVDREALLQLNERYLTRLNEFGESQEERFAEVFAKELIEDQSGELYEQICAFRSEYCQL